MNFHAYGLPIPKIRRIGIDQQGVRLRPKQPGSHRSPQLLKTMKLMIIFIFACSLSVAAKPQSLSMSFSNAPLAQVLNEIHKQSGYNFTVLLDDLKGYRTTFKVKDATVDQTMQACLTGLPLTYTIEDKFISISPKPKEVQQPAPADSNKVIHGRIVDENGAPISGASVSLKGASSGTMTNEKGEFDLNLPMDATVTISHIGFETVEVKIKHKSELAVVLKKFVTALKEISVSYSNGYQEIPKERATGSFDFIDNKLLDREVSPDVLSRLDGIASAVFFDTRLGNTTTPASVRGLSTISASTQPLIIVDNFQYNGDLGAINPNDVQSITVLKDAAAASIWGARAGNGVIVITTKKGKYNQPLKVEVNSNFTVAEKPNLFYSPNWMNSTDFINVETYLFSQGFYNSNFTNPAQPPVSPVVSLLDQAQNGTITQAAANASIDSLRNHDVRNDLKKYFYRPQTNQQYAVNVSGGDAKSAYFLSMGYDHNLLPEVGDQYQRYSLNSAYSFTPVKNLEVSANIVYTETGSFANNALSQISTDGNYQNNIYPYAELADAKGNPLPIVKDYNVAFASQAQQKGFLNWQFYPLQELRGGYNTTTSKEYDTRINSGVKYSFLRGFSADIRYQYERAVTDGNNLATQQSYYARNLINEYSNVNSNGTFSSTNIPVGDILNTSSSVLLAQDARTQLSYNHEWGQHTLSAIGGWEVGDASNSGNANTIYGYNHLLGTSQPVNYTTYFKDYPQGYYMSIPYGASVTGTDQRFVSAFADMAYTFNSKYTLSVSGRRDASNAFGVNTNNQWKPLWSSGIKWDISKETFYSSRLLPKLDFRATYGYSGNVVNSVSAVPVLYYYSGLATYTHQVYASVISAANPNLKWEDIGMFNAAIDFSSKKDILQGSIEYYSKNSSDLVQEVPLDPTAGLSGENAWENSANLKGHGVDIDLRLSEIYTRDFRWSTQFLLSYFSDKVTKYLASSNPVASDYIGVPFSPDPIPGRALESANAYKWGGLDTAGNPQGYFGGKLSEDYSSIMNDSVNKIVYKGSALPLYYGAIRNTFSWKSISLSFNIVYRFDYWFQKSTINYYSLYNNWDMNNDYYRRWQKPGDEKTTTVPSMDYPANQYRDEFYAGAEPNFLKGDNIRFKDIRLDYSFRVKTSKSKFYELQVYSYINNVGILWRANKDHLDPDFGSQIPPSRSIAFGVKANL
jgi:TonB-dependent starch-binding outer membrane protein SusC